MSDENKKTVDAATIKRWRNDIVFSDTIRDVPLSFHSTWGLFSPERVDDGSRLLLDHLEINPTDDCLDVGCGVGVLGLIMAKLAQQGNTLMVDKDFVAVEYSKKNISLNKITNAEAVLSNGFNHIGDKKFDLIVSNLPAKVSNEQHYLYLVDAFEHLKPGGRFCVVTISGLRKFIERTFKEVFGSYEKLKQGGTYTVAQAVKQRR